MLKAKTTPAHEYASFFPLNEGQPLWDLADRIKEHGQREPIVLLDGKILDGRRRELACIRAQVKPRYRQFGSRKEDGNDPLEFVYDMNYPRRHLGEGDRAIVAARFAKARIGRPPIIASDGGDFKDSTYVEPGGSSLRTNADAAERFGVTESAIDRAKAVVANGTPELQQAVSDETITLSDAAKVATETPDVQNAAIKSVMAGQSKSAAAAVKAIKKAASAAARQAAAAAEEKIIPKDRNGVEYPEHALPAIYSVRELDEFRRDVKALIERAKQIKEMPIGQYLDATGICARLDEVRGQVLAAKPDYVCGYCNGTDKKCKGCDGCGWQTRRGWNSSPKGIAEKTS